MSVLPGIGGIVSAPRVGAVTPIITGWGSGQTGAANSCACTYPAGIVAGDLLLLLINAVSGPGADPSTPAGFTQLWEQFYPTGALTAQLAFKVATGGESGTIVSNSVNAAYWCMLCFRITGHAAVAVGDGLGAAVLTGNGLSANPPGLTTPNWLADEKTLWLVPLMQTNHIHPPSGPPAGYGEVTYYTAANPSINRVTLYSKAGVGGTDDPGLINYATADYFAVGTTAIRGGG